MRERYGVFLMVFILVSYCFSDINALDVTQEHETQSTLPLLNPAPEEIAIPNWPGDRPLPNSIRAWHYNPDLVSPLLEIGQAVDNSILDIKMRRMLAAVVASRNKCLY